LAAIAGMRLAATVKKTGLEKARSGSSAMTMRLEVAEKRDQKRIRGKSSGGGSGIAAKKACSRVTK